MYNTYNGILLSCAHYLLLVSLSHPPLRHLMLLVSSGIHIFIHMIPRQHSSASSSSSASISVSSASTLTSISTSFFFFFFIIIIDRIWCVGCWMLYSFCDMKLKIKGKETPCRTYTSYVELFSWWITACGCLLSSRLSVYVVVVVPYIAWNISFLFIFSFLISYYYKV